MAPSSPPRKEPSSAAMRASTGATALTGRKKRKTPPPPVPEEDEVRGQLPNGTAIAVKKLEGLRQGEKQLPVPFPEAASGAMQPPAPFQRTWLPHDEIRILEALATHRREHDGCLPTPAELFGALDGRLEKKGVGPKQLAIKQRSFKRRYDRDVMKTAPPADEHERRLYLLSRDVWGPVPPPRPPVAEVGRATQGKGTGAQASKDAAQAKRADHQSGKEAVKPEAKNLDEMRKLYPYLVDEATILFEPVVLETLLLSIEDSEAQVVETKIRKARKKLAKAITESARVNNMEMPKVFLLTSSKLQPEKLIVENENNLLVDHLDKTDDVDLCTKQRLARVEHQVVELRQVVIASQSQAKAIRCESANSGLHLQSSIVADNIEQQRVEAPNGLIHGNTVEVEVTSKHHCAVRHNVPPNNPKMQGVVANACPAMPRRFVKKKPTPCKATCRGGHMLTRL